MNTSYRFTTKDGHRYSCKAANPVEARESIELAYRINLAGATMEVLWKLRVIETRKVR